MPPVQRTFQLVPESVAKPMSRPPMTSKAAKKAYLKANQGPKVSRAEQRRLDREAVERLNREYEKEKAAAKAKAAREKKAAKANAEKEERRRNGIPEPSRFVRASQPTISRFVRPGSKRTREEMEDEDEEAEDTPAEEEVFETMVKDPIMEQSGEPKDAPVGKSVSPTTDMEPPTKKVAMTAEIESEDEFGDFPSLSQINILQKVDSPPVSSNEDDVVSNPAQKEPSDSDSDDFLTLSQCEILEKGNLPPGAITISRSGTPNSQKPSKSPSPGKTTQEKLKQTPRSNLCDKVPITKSQSPADKAQPPILPKPAEYEAIYDGLKAAGNIKQPMVSLDGTPKAIADPSALRTMNGQKSHTTPVASYPPKQSSTSRKVNMPPPNFVPARHPLHGRSANNSMPPPALPKSNKAKSFSPLPAISRFSSRNTPVRAYKSPAPNLPPTPTQAFLENNLDDFFPSPSQEIRELLDDMDDLPSNTQISRELSPLKQVSKENDDPLKYLFPTPEFAPSSGNTPGLDTPSRAPNPAINQRRNQGPPGKYTKTSNQPHPRSPLVKENIMKPTPPPIPSNRVEWKRPKPFIATTKPSPPLQKPHQKLTTQTPPQTTALARSQNGNTTAPTPHIPPPPTNEQNKFDPHPQPKSSPQNPPPIPPRIPLPPPPKRRFFEEKEEDLLHGALWESRLEARAAKKARQQAQAQAARQKSLDEQTRRQAQAQAEARKNQEGEGLLQRAMRESREEAEAEAIKRRGWEKEKEKEKEKERTQNTENENVQKNENHTSKSSPRKKRSLQRVPSTVTDYGDDDLSGCSQELLALCY